MFLVPRFRFHKKLRSRLESTSIASNSASASTTIMFSSSVPNTATVLSPLSTAEPLSALATGSKPCLPAHAGELASQALNHGDSMGFTWSPMHPIPKRLFETASLNFGATTPSPLIFCRMPPPRHSSPFLVAQHVERYTSCYCVPSTLEYLLHSVTVIFCPLVNYCCCL